MKTYEEFVEQISGYAKLRYGSTPATATQSSISGSIDRALSNMGSSQSASQTTGRTGLSGSGSVSYSGTIGNRPSSLSPSSSTPTPRPKPQSTAPRPPKPLPRKPSSLTPSSSGTSPRPTPLSKSGTSSGTSGGSTLMK